MRKKFDAAQDIFYSNNYISLYLKHGDELFEFEYKNGDDFFLNKSIKRPIQKIAKSIVTDGFYDLETAYGYGGFYTNSKSKEFIRKSLSEYYKRCKAENIIAEFIRFHPFNSFPVDHDEFLDFNIYDRDTVVVALYKGYDSIRSQYSSSLKRNINKAKRCGLKYKQLSITDKNISKFCELYYETMRNNNADDFYFFNEEYFENLFNIEYVTLHGVYCNEIIINMAIIFTTTKNLYYHLGATDSNYYNSNPNALLFDSIIQTALENYDYLYLGGGATSVFNDPLLKFKQKFSNEIKPFYISGNIYNSEMYNAYINIWKEQNNEDLKFFLKYRFMDNGRYK